MRIFSSRAWRSSPLRLVHTHQSDLIRLKLLRSHKVLCFSTGDNTAPDIGAVDLAMTMQIWRTTLRTSAIGFPEYEVDGSVRMNYRNRQTTCEITYALMVSHHSTAQTESASFHPYQLLAHLCHHIRLRTSRPSSPSSTLA
jgi:hypothetical protein